MTFRVHFARWAAGGRLVEQVDVEADTPDEAIARAAHADKARDIRAGRSWTGDFNRATAERTFTTEEQIEALSRAALTPAPGTKQAPR